MVSERPLLQSTTVLARTRRFLDWRACKPKVGLRTSSHTAVRLRCELAINGCPRGNKRADGCPRAQRARACCQQEPAKNSAAPARVQREHDQTRYSRLRPRAHPRVRGGSAASFLSLVGPARVSLASPARVDGDTAGLSRRGRSPRSFAGGARVRRHSGRREVVAHDARSERGLGLGHPLLLPAARPGGTCGGVSFHWGRGDGVRVGLRWRARRRRARRSQQQHRRRRPGAGWAKGITSRSRSTARGAGARPRTSPTSSSGSTTRSAWRGWSRRATR